jgi:hypothetical protein
MESVVTDLTPVAEILEQAAEDLTRDGWRAGSWGTPGSNQCIVGALRSASTARFSCDHFPQQSCANRRCYICRSLERMQQFNNAVFIVAQELNLGDNSQDDLIRWNDTVCSSGEEAADALISAAKRIRNA